MSEAESLTVRPAEFWRRRGGGRGALAEWRRRRALALAVARDCGLRYAWAGDSVDCHHCRRVLFAIHEFTGEFSGVTADGQCARCGGDVPMVGWAEPQANRAAPTPAQT